MKQNSLNGWFKSGAPGVWISGGAVSIAVIMTIGLLAVIAVRGLGHFWPADLIQANYNVPGQANHIVIGEVVQKEEVPRERLKSAGLPVPDEGPEFMTRELIKVGNRDLNGNDFTWIVGEWLTNQKTPPELMLIVPVLRKPAPTFSAEAPVCVIAPPVTLITPTEPTLLMAATSTCPA